jgi:hypothetical protein
MNILPLRKPEEFDLGWVARQLGNTQWAEMLGRLPTVEVESLTHIGSLMGRPDLLIQGRSSFEGGLLSASEHPEAWEEIAKLGGLPWWEIAGEENMALLEIVGHDELWEKTTWWGVSVGLLQAKTVWKTPISTDEEDEVLWTICHSLKEAEDEYEPDLGKIEEKTVHLPAPNLWAYWNQIDQGREEGRKPQPDYARSALAALLLETGAAQGWGFLHEESPLIGLHWNEELNPAILSAPRAGLSPGAILLHAEQISIETHP